MKNKRTIILAGLLLAIGVLTSACSVNIERNADGSLTVTSTMTEASLQSELQAALPNLHSLTADIRDGAIFVTAQRERLDGSQTDDISFRVDLSVVEGHLGATISQMTVNGEPANEERVEKWNERIAERLERATDRHPNRTLQSVSLADNTLTTIWHVETQRSQSNNGNGGD